MKTKQTQLRIRLGLQLLVISIIAAVFTLFYLENVDSVNKVVVFKNTTDAFWNLPAEINLPFAANKLLNILLVIAFCYVIAEGIKYLDRAKHRSNEAIIGIIYGLLFGVIAGAWLMVVGSINQYVEFVFGIGLLIVLAIEIMATLEDNIASGLKLGLATALSAGVLVGLMVGLKTNFAAGLLASLMVAAIVATASAITTLAAGIIKFLFSKKTWGGIFNLLNGLSFND